MAEKQPRGSDPLDKVNEAATDPKAAERLAEKVVDVREEAQQETEKLEAERQVAGFAPRLDPSDPRPREAKEADVREALGIDMGVTDFKAPDLGASTSVKPKTSAEMAAEQERLRSGPSMPPGEIVDVTVNGVRYRVPTGEDVKVPAAVAEVLANRERPIRTTQMLGGGDGVPTIDLTRK